MVQYVVHNSCTYHLQGQWFLGVNHGLYGGTSTEYAVYLSELPYMTSRASRIGTSTMFVSSPSPVASLQHVQALQPCDPEST